MQQVNQILQNKNLTLEMDARAKQRHLKNEWMAFAFKVWKEFSNNNKELPNLIRHFKIYHVNDRALLDRAYSYCKDYTGMIPKLKLFYWAFWQFKKNGRIVSKF